MEKEKRADLLIAAYQDMEKIANQINGNRFKINPHKKV